MKKVFEDEFEKSNSTPPRLSLFSQRFSSPEPEGGGFTPPPHTGATVPFQWEETPGKPRSTTTALTPLKSKSIMSLNLPPRMFINSTTTTPTNSIIPSPTSVVDGSYEGMRFLSSSNGKSKWKKMMMMPLRKMIMCKDTSSSLKLRSWSWDSFTDISSSSRGGSDGSSTSSFDDDLSNSLDSNSKIKEVWRRHGLIFFNKTTFSILENMNQSIIQAVPYRR